MIRVPTYPPIVVPVLVILPTLLLSLLVALAPLILVISTLLLCTALLAPPSLGPRVVLVAGEKAVLEPFLDPLPLVLILFFLIITRLPLLSVMMKQPGLLRLSSRRLLFFSFVTFSLLPLFLARFLLLHHSNYFWNLSRCRYL